MKHGHPNAAWSNLISPGLKLANCADFVTWMWGYYMSKDANFNVFYPRSISDVQLFVQITSGIDISEELFNYFKSKNHETI